MCFVICGPDDVVNVGHHGSVAHLLSMTVYKMDLNSFSQKALILAYHQTLMYIYMNDSIGY